MEQEIEKNVLFFRQFYLTYLRQILTVTGKVLVIWSECVNKQSEGFTYY